MNASPRRIGILGFGRIGRAVAANLRAADFAVATLDRPSTRDFDAFDKLEEYKAVASLAVILLVEPNAPEIALWRRDADGAWQRRLVAGLEQAIELPEFGMTLALADVYDGVAFPPRPRLVSGT